MIFYGIFSRISLSFALFCPQMGQIIFQLTCKNHSSLPKCVYDSFLQEEPVGLTQESTRELLQNDLGTPF